MVSCGNSCSGVLDFGDVFIHVAEMHVPVVKIVADHRVVFAETDFLEADFDSVRGVFDRFADRVPAKRRVHVIISRKAHNTQADRAWQSFKRPFRNLRGNFASRFSESAIHVRARNFPEAVVSRNAQEQTAFALCHPQPRKQKIAADARIFRKRLFEGDGQCERARLKAGSKIVIIKLAGTVFFSSLTHISKMVA